jgi:hypothetical protein
MIYFPTQSLCSPQLDIDNAPIRTFALGQNALFKDLFKAPIMPNVYTTFPRANQTANQIYIGRHILMPETYNYNRAYQPKLTKVLQRRRTCQSRLRRFLSGTLVASSGQCFLSRKYYR